MKLGELAQLPKVAELASYGAEFSPRPALALNHSVLEADGWARRSPGRVSGVGTPVLTLHCIMWQFGASPSVHSLTHRILIK